MIDYAGWEKYRLVVVTGPQRAGTTFCSHVVAADTGRELILETRFQVGDEKAWRRLVESAENAVLHCPSMMHLVGELPSDVLVVVMRRALADIHRSAERVGWEGEFNERRKFVHYSGTSAARKYAWWADNQDRVASWTEVEFESLSDHPLWVPADQRREFGIRQVTA